MTEARVHLIGVSPEARSLSPEEREVVASCGLLAGARRHLDLVPEFAGETWAVEGKLPELVARIASEPGLRAAVLASGDPGFFGVAGLVYRHIPREEVRVWPAVSSMQLAFARAGETWSEARFASLHGRPIENLSPVLGEPGVGVFTDPANTPPRIARFLLDSGWGDLEMVVAEDLGLPTERVSRGNPEDLLRWEGSPLNVVLLVRRGPDPRRLGPGLPDSDFSHSRGLITKAEVRAVALGLLGLRRGGVLWDVGAGSGSVSVEACLLTPGLRAYAVEKAREGFEHTVENRRRFRCAGLQPVFGEAPAALAELPNPGSVFVGGSGGLLGPILDRSWERLCPGGHLVAAAVLVDTLCEVLGWARERGLAPALTEVGAARSRALSGSVRLEPQNAVTLAQFVKPSEGAAP